MAHGLILGMTESGKTSMAKKLAHQLKANGTGVLVLDPLCDPSWNADFQTDNPDEFLDVYWQSRACVAFIDEAGDVVGQYDKIMAKTATRGRHWGHSNFYLSQRGTMISRTVRDQCSYLFLFATALDDCKTHAAEWNSPELKEANGLKQGEYFYTGRFSQAERRKLF